MFAVVMLGCLWGGIRFLSGIDIFSRNIPYYVAYPEISGIQTATPVTIQGVKVGTVTAIGFDPSVSRDVVLQLTVRRSFRIPRDSKARIYSDGFMGGKAIAIEMGDSPQLLSKGDTLVAAETRDMLAAAGTELADVKERLTRVMDNLSVTLESVNAVLKDNKGNIDGTLTHLNSISGNMDAVLAAGPNSCPPMVVGVGLGGTIEVAALCAKRAAARDLESRNPDPRYAAFEDELLELINRTGIGPQGLGGETTALKVHVEWAPTHIASLPVAVNINCHAARHAEVRL